MLALVRGLLLQGHPCSAKAPHARNVSPGPRPSTLVNASMGAQAPAIDSLARSSKPFRLMLGLQEEIWAGLHEHSALRPVPTTVSEDGQATYNSADEQASFRIQVAEGRNITWAVSSTSAFAKLGGSVRVNVFPDAGDRIPKLDVEIFSLADTVSMYVNLVPRANLLLDEPYLRRFYAEGDPSWQSLFLAARDSPAFRPFLSRGLDMRVLAGQTALFFSADNTEENTAEMCGYGRKALGLWLAWYGAGPVSPPGDDAERAELARLDAVLLGYARRDPDNARVVPVVGERAVEEMLRLATRDPRILRTT